VNPAVQIDQPILQAGFYIWLASEAETALLARAFFLNLFLAVPFYLAIPVCGPAFAYPAVWKTFPLHLPNDSPRHMIPIDAAPNGIPSVHMATALLIFWFLRRWWWGSLVGFGFVLLTILSTLGLGQHYLFDLICAIPYAVLVYLLATYRPFQPSKPLMQETYMTHRRQTVQR
jgi:membrane-associated phospholipid phosphatase